MKRLRITAYARSRRERRWVLANIFRLGALVAGLGATLSAPACGGGPNSSRQTASPGVSLGTASDALASQLKSSYRGHASQEPPLVVVDFVDPSGEACPAGGAIANEISAALFRTGGFRVMERAELPRILEEQALSMSDLMVAETASRVGRGIGASLFVTGSISLVGEGYELSARIVDVESFEVVAVGRATVGGMEVTSRGGCGLPRVVATGGPGMQVAGGPASTPPPAASEGPPNALYYEDFSEIADGQAPLGWRGVENYAVTRDGRGRASFGPFQSGQARFSIPHGLTAFPERFRIGVVVSQHWQRTCSDVVIQLGSVSLRVIVVFSQGRLNGGEFRIDSSTTPEVGDMDISVIRDGNVLEVMFDGRRATIARDSSMELGGALVLDVTGGSGCSHRSSGAIIRSVGIFTLDR